MSRGAAVAERKPVAAASAPSPQAHEAPRAAESGALAFALATRVSGAGGPLERDADAAAARALGTPAPAASAPERSSVAPPGLSAMLAGVRAEATPLPPSARRAMETRMGADFSSVRISAGPGAAAATRAVDAVAFTHRDHIAFAPGRFDPASAPGKQLLAHELAHTVQQGGARARGTNAPRARLHRPRIQRQGVREWMSRQWDRLPSLPDVASIVARVAPGLAEVIREGPVGWLAHRVRDAVRGWVSGLVSGLGLGNAVSTLRSGFGRVMTLLSRLAQGGASACAAFAQILDGLREAGRAIANSGAVRMISSAFSAVERTVGRILRLVVGAAVDTIAPLLGAAWRGVSAVASTVWGWIRTVKNAIAGAAGAAWSWVSRQLGFGSGEGDSESGVLAWLGRKAQAAWATIRATYAPVIGPLTTVARVLLLVSPIGPVVLLVTKGPELVRAVQWLWANRNDPNIVRRARHEMSGTFLPGLLDAVASFRRTLGSAADWLVKHVGALATAALSLAGRLTGLPVLGAARGFVQRVADGARDVAAWATERVRAAVRAITGVFASIRRVVEPWKEVLSSIALAIVDPPLIPMILLGWAWRRLPACFKPPIINFILDIAIAAIRALPRLVIFGPLWALLKDAIVAFLEQVRTKADAIKERISNRIARMMSGSSPEFLLGFVRGFLRGVWEGITDPIKAIAMVIDGLNWVRDFLTGAAARALGLPAPPPTPRLMSLFAEGEHGGSGESGNAGPAQTGAAGATSGSATGAAGPGGAAAEAGASTAGAADGSVASSADHGAAAHSAGDRPAAGTAVHGVSPGAAAVGAGVPGPATRGPSAATSAPALPGVDGHGSLPDTSSGGATASPGAVAVAGAVSSAVAGATPAGAAPLSSPPADVAVSEPQAAGSVPADTGAPSGTSSLAEHPSGQPIPAAGGGTAVATGPAPAAGSGRAPAAPAAPAVDIAAPEPPGVGAPVEGRAAATHDPDLASQLGAMGRELQPDVQTATSGFLPAIREYFSSGGGMTFDQLLTKLGEAWSGIRARIQGASRELADKVTDFFDRDGAEGEIGDGIGWLGGTISFQLLLDALTTGAWAGVSPILTAIARFINWPMEVMGQAFKLLSRLGRYLLDAVKGLGRMVSRAGGALGRVVEALSSIGRKLGEFAERFAGRGARGGLEAAEAGTGRAAAAAERRVATTAEREVAAGAAAERRAAQTVEREAATTAEHEGAAVAEHESAAATERRAAQSAEREGAQTAEREGAQAAASQTQRLQAVTAARGIVTWLQTRRVPAILVRAALMPLRLRWRWIKGFELNQIAPHEYEVIMIASRIPVTVYYDAAAGGRQGPFQSGRTANTGGISRIEGSVLPGNAQSFRISGEVRPGSLVRKSRPLKPGEVRAPSFERQFARGRELGLPNYERAHLWGPGFGDEARAGIMYAPDSVNRGLQSHGQAHGVEGWISGLADDARALGGRVEVTATAVSHPRPSITAPQFLKEAQYEVKVTVPGQAPRFYRGHIEVGEPPGGAATVEIGELLLHR